MRSLYLSSTFQQMDRKNAAALLVQLLFCLFNEKLPICN